MEEQKQTFNWQRLLITAVMVIVAAGAVGGTTYYVLNSNFQKERDANEKSMNAIQVQLKKATEKADNTSTTTTATTPVADWHTYKNTAYGFQMTFPESWKGYKLFQKTISYTTGIGDVSTWYVALPTTDSSWTESGIDKGYASLFAISAFKPAQWDQLQSEDGPKDLYLDKNTNYTFGTMSSQAGPLDLKDRVPESLGVAKSLKAF